MTWERVKLGKITTNLDSRRKPLNSQERDKISSEQLYPYIGANNIMGYVDEFLFDEEILCVAEDGGSWGKSEKCCSYYNEKCWVNNHAHVLGFNGKANLKFLLYYLNHEDLNKVITGTTRGKLTKSALLEIKIPLPPLSIQQKIAAILDKADALRRKDQELLKKYDDLAQAIFIDMFGDPVKNEKGWEVRKFKEKIKSIRYGIGSPPNYVDTGIPFIRATNIKKGIIVEKDMVYVSIEESMKIEKCFVNNGDLIIVRSGVNTGDCGIITEKYHRALAGYDLVVEIDLTISRFYHFLINSEWGHRIIKPLSRRAAQPHLNAEQVNQLEFIEPPIEKVIEFCRILEKIESSILIIEKTKNVNESLFQSLLQAAFKGELV